MVKHFRRKNPKYPSLRFTIHFFKHRSTPEKTGDSSTLAVIPLFPTVIRLGCWGYEGFWEFCWGCGDF